VNYIRPFLIITETCNITCTQWTNWINDACSVSCGLGMTHRIRTRRCPQKDCSESNVIMAPCEEMSCYSIQYDQGNILGLLTYCDNSFVIWGFVGSSSTT